MFLNNPIWSIIRHQTKFCKNFVLLNLENTSWYIFYIIGESTYFNMWIYIYLFSIQNIKSSRASKPSCVDMILNHLFWFIIRHQEKYLQQCFSIKYVNVHRYIYFTLSEHLCFFRLLHVLFTWSSLSLIKYIGASMYYNATRHLNH